MTEKIDIYATCEDYTETLEALHKIPLDVADLLDKAEAWSGRALDLYTRDQAPQTWDDLADLLERLRDSLESEQETPQERPRPLPRPYGYPNITI